MLVRRAKMIEVECVARGYVSGSGWKDYRREGRICGIPLPAGLRESDGCQNPFFTPASKAQSGGTMRTFPLKLLGADWRATWRTASAS